MIDILFQILKFLYDGIVTLITFIFSIPSYLSMFLDKLDLLFAFQLPTVANAHSISITCLTIALLVGIVIKIKRLII